MGDIGFLVDGYTSFDAWVAASGRKESGETWWSGSCHLLLRKNGIGLLTDLLGCPCSTEYQVLPGLPAI